MSNPYSSPNAGHAITAYHVAVRTATRRFVYIALAASSFDAHDAALERFWPCAVSVEPLAQ